MCVFVQVCVSGCMLLCSLPVLIWAPGVLSLTEQETILAGERGRRLAREGKRKRGGESWRREVNEKFIQLQVPNALLSLPGVLILKRLGR